MSHHSRYNKGFSLTELLFTLGIMTVILSVVLSNQSTYTDTAALTNLADDIGLAVSQSQVYGVGVKEFTPGSNDFSISYGLSFSLLVPGGSIGYIHFADRDGDKVYDSGWGCPIGGTSECLKVVNIIRGNYIDSFCVVVNGGPDQCGTAKRVDISFTRPNIKAQIMPFDSTGTLMNVIGMRGVKIVLKSPKGTTRNVVVYETGQVSVQ